MAATPYFVRTGTSTFRPTQHASGAWNIDEQHISPALGVLLHEVERDRDARRTDALVASRLSYDILGTVPMDEVTTSVAVLRPGRTIELVEATLSYAGRSIVSLRVWLTMRTSSESVVGSDFPTLPPRSSMPDWNPSTVWPGGFIGSAQVRRDEQRPGRAAYWVRTDVPLLDEPVSRLAAAAGLLDITNGMTVRNDPARVAFPNIDLTAHLFREPAGEWLGFDTTVSFGPTGQGLTASVLHDESGPYGTMAQTLTVRPL